MPVELHAINVQVAGSNPAMCLLKAVHVAQWIEQVFHTPLLQLFFV